MPDRFLMNRISDMITNFGALIFDIVFIIIRAIPTIIIALFYFCIFEMIAHTYLGIFAYQSFKNKGKKTIYIPGSATTYTMFLPIAIVYVFIFITGMFILGCYDWILGGALGGFELLILIIIPESLLKNRNRSYPFAEKYKYGYFKKFIDRNLD